MASSTTNSGRGEGQQNGAVDVLIVDDDAAILEQLAECFAVSGVATAMESNALIALKRISKGLRPAVVLTDLRMPDLDGLHFAQRLNQLPREIRPEIIFMSGHADMKDAIEAIRLGARDLLIKPIDRDKILRSVEAARLLHDQARQTTAPVEEGPESRPSVAGASDDADIRRKALATLRKVRKVRSKYLPEELFSDPCWEMLLDLYDSRLSGEDVTVTGLGVTSGVPMSTALRRLQELQRHRLIERIEDRSDKRRQLVTLTPDGLRAIDNFFDGYLGRVAQ
jgi:FixJ family two-component response regulator/DNA-binding MarR family transcriptional regulator